MQQPFPPITNSSNRPGPAQGQAPTPPAGAARRPYERPAILDYGSVQALTRGAGSMPTFDMMSGTRRKK